MPDVLDGVARRATRPVRTVLKLRQISGVRGKEADGQPNMYETTSGNLVEPPWHRDAVDVPRCRAPVLSTGLADRQAVRMYKVIVVRPNRNLYFMFQNKDV